MPGLGFPVLTSLKPETLKTQETTQHKPSLKVFVVVPFKKGTLPSYSGETVNFVLDKIFPLSK